MDEIRATLKKMLGPDIGIGVTDPREKRDDLLPKERAFMSRAVPKRLYEFAAGRRAARSAMKELGLEPAAISVGSQREPLWPQDLTGSIAHCDTCCIAAVSKTHRALGIDIEPLTPLDADLIELVCTDAERQWLRILPENARALTAKKIFCAKEAFYKAQYPLAGKLLGFADIEVRLQDGAMQTRLNMGGQSQTFSITQDTAQAIFLSVCCI